MCVSSAKAATIGKANRFIGKGPFCRVRLADASERLARKEPSTKARFRRRERPFSLSLDAAPHAAAPKAPRSSLTRRNAGKLARSSRQARLPANTTAAGIVAASMARRCQTPSKAPTRFAPANVVRRQTMRGTARKGTLRSEVRGGGRRPGDTSGEESPSESCPHLRVPTPAADAPHPAAMIRTDDTNAIPFTILTPPCAKAPHFVRVHPNVFLRTVTPRETPLHSLDEQ
jgi:hypothetical protein